MGTCGRLKGATVAGSWRWAAIVGYASEPDDAKWDTLGDNILVRVPKLVWALSLATLTLRPEPQPEICLVGTVRWGPGILLLTCHSPGPSASVPWMLESFGVHQEGMGCCWPCWLCCVVLCCVALRCVALRCVVLRCVVLCCVVLCCVVLPCAEMLRRPLTPAV